MINNSIIKVQYKSTRDPTKAKELLESLVQYPYIGLDFETASKYSVQEVELMQEELKKEDLDFFLRKELEAKIKVDGLSHPSQTVITHLNIAWSNNEAYVLLVDTDEMLELIMDFLVNSEIKQIWHNASFDFKHIYYHTGKMPKDYEDTQIYSKTILNHCENYKSKTGLKLLAGAAYGDWALSADSFTKDRMYDEVVIKYAATDACATVWVYERLLEQFEGDFEASRSTAEDYTPWTQLPAPEPCTVDYHPSYFYYNTAKFLVRDTVRLMGNGLPVDLVKVRALDEEVGEILKEIDDRLHSNPYIQQYLQEARERAIKKKEKENRSKMKSVDSFIQQFNPKDAVHKSYFMNCLADLVGFKKPTELLPSGKPKWSHTLIKKIAKSNKVAERLVNKDISHDNKLAQQAMLQLAEDKAAVYNKKYLGPVELSEKEEPRFNPRSAKQKRELFEMLDVEPEEFSPTTGDASWDREQIERVNREYTDELIVDLTQAMIDNSFAAIISSTFIPALFRYSIEGRLYGNLVLLGAKSGRFTSNSPRFWAL